MIATGSSLESHKVLTVDCDDTLVMWQLSMYPDLPRVEVALPDIAPSILVLNQKNVNLVKKFYKLGFKIVVWSQTGYDWAKAVAEAVGLSEYVTLYMTKPRYHVDDLPSSVWMGERLWRDPVTGVSEDKYND